MDEWGQNHTQAILTPRKKARWYLSRRLGGPQNRSGRLTIKEKSLVHDGMEVQNSALTYR